MAVRMPTSAMMRKVLMEMVRMVRIMWLRIDSSEMRPFSVTRDVSVAKVII